MIIIEKLLWRTISVIGVSLKHPRTRTKLSNVSNPESKSVSVAVRGSFVMYTRVLCHVKHLYTVG